jgi:4a-hydroxytetrahydrobiopterin dehydratase
MSDLAKMECIPCKGGVPPLKGSDLTRLLERLGNGWRIVEQHHLEKGYAFSNFRQALAFTNRVGELAEEQGHHPDVHLAWGKVVLTVWTHKIDGLTESDFVFAAKADQRLYPGQARAKNADGKQDSDDIRRAVDDGMQDLRGFGKR